MDEQLIIEVWDVFREYVPEKSRETAANHYVDFLIGRDVELSDLESVQGYDPFLDGAIELVLEANRDVDESDTDWDYDDDNDGD